MADELTAMSQNGENIIVAPIGMDVELTFPTREIINSYNANQGELSVINSLSFEIPAEKITNDYNITPPPYLLLVKTSYKDEFLPKATSPTMLSHFMPHTTPRLIVIYSLTCVLTFST